MYTQACASEEFMFKQSSTFAGGSLGCRIGLRTLQLITDNEGALMQNALEVPSPSLAPAERDEFVMAYMMTTRSRWATTSSAASKGFALRTRGSARSSRR